MERVPDGFRLRESVVDAAIVPQGSRKSELFRGERDDSSRALCEGGEKRPAVLTALWNALIPSPPSRCVGHRLASAVTTRALSCIGCHGNRLAVTRLDAILNLITGSRPGPTAKPSLCG